MCDPVPTGADESGFIPHAMQDAPTPTANTPVPGPPLEPGLARPATIADVAVGAGVSMATVSRALRGLPNVAPATRQKVQQEAQRLSYRPDPHASRLAAGRTHSVGMAVPELGRWYFSQVVSGARDTLNAHGYDLLLFGVGNGEERRRFVREWGVLGKRVDGLLLVDLRLDTDELADVNAAGMHVVSVGDSYDELPSVTVDNRSAAATAVRHLVALGHRHIALIGEDDHQRHFSVPQFRRCGWIDALAEAGIAPRPELEIPGNFTVAGGYRAMTQLLGCSPPPTAVFAMSDEMAMGAIKAVRDHGLDVPGDVSVVGFDDHDLAHIMDLTTVRQPVIDSGARAATLLIEAIGGQHGSPHDVRPTELIVRASTGPSRTDTE